MDSCMKVQTKSLSQRGACLAVASLFCGLFYNGLTTWFFVIFGPGLNFVAFPLGFLFFALLPSVFWISLVVLLASLLLDFTRKEAGR